MRECPIHGDRTVDVARLRELLQSFFQVLEVDQALVHTIDYVELCSLINTAPALLDAYEAMQRLQTFGNFMHIADGIAELRAERDRYRAALEEIAEGIGQCQSSFSGCNVECKTTARAALGKDGQ